jgi:NTE family protein
VTTDVKKRVSLVLGSGGARGLAHIGVIRELEAAGYQIASLSGCSIGALIGGVYAAGKLDEFDSWVRAINRLDMVSLLDMSWSSDGLVKGDKIIDTLVELVGDRRIEDLPIPYTAIAADIKNEKEVWLRSGRLFDAIRASISLPLFFTPVPYKGSHLIDGGVLNPVPIAPTFNDDTDITIAVNLGGPPGDLLVDSVENKTDNASKSMGKRIARYVSDLRSSKKSGRSDRVGAYDIADQAFDAMQGTIARHKLAAYPPDIVIEISRNACGTFDFDRAAQIIDLGHRKARGALSLHAN